MIHPSDMSHGPILSQATEITNAPANPKPWEDLVWRIGMILLLFGVLIFQFVPTSQTSGGLLIGDGIFALHYLMVVFYFIVQFQADQIRWWIFSPKADNYHTFFVFLSIWLVSCFSLNKSMTLFQQSTTWLDVHLTLSVLCAIAYAFKERFSPVVRALWLGGMAWSAVLMFYFAVYLTQYYFIGGIGTIFLGIGLHVFVPLVFFVTIVRALIKEVSTEQEQMPAASVLTKPSNAVLLGMTLPILTIIAFTFIWSSRTGMIENTMRERKIDANTDLPAWVQLSQQLPKDWLSERILKTNIVYQTQDNWQMWSGGRSAEMKKKHDPLVLIASAFSDNKAVLDQTQRSNILRSVFDGRHVMQEKLWTGVDLVTHDLITTAVIDAPHRLAYTEKIVTIRNTDPSRWNLTQEALYTFYLPEGGVVSALSLWINGEEQKSRLAGKSIADSAYTTIVGRERRDPSIVHWQEGNRVTVRVFPCTKDEDRVFKIGVTSPLTVVGNQISYQNIAFQGPPMKRDEHIKFVLQPNTQFSHQHQMFKRQDDGAFLARQAYRPNWSQQFDFVPFESAQFHFGSKTYTTQTFQNRQTKFSPKGIYLDTHHAWTKHEVKSILDAAGATPVYATDYLGRFQQINAAQLDRNWNLYTKNLCPLFPFYQLPEPTECLVVSKYSGSALALKDLGQSPFIEKLRDKLTAQTARIKVFILGGEPDLYTRTLADLRCIQTKAADLDEITQSIKLQLFDELIESDNSVVIPHAQMLVKESVLDTTVRQQNAPHSHHLMRLFAYNQIMGSIGAKYLNKKYEPEPLVKQAHQAYVVTPVSSMVVLESEADYERFGIKKGSDSLDNASANNAGAAPEPHEWAIIICLLLALYFVHKKPLKATAA